VQAFNETPHIWPADRIAEIWTFRCLELQIDISKVSKKDTERKHKKKSPRGKIK